MVKKKCCNKWKKKGKACKGCPIQETLMQRGYIKARKIKLKDAAKPVAHQRNKLELLELKPKADPVLDLAHACTMV